MSEGSRLTEAGHILFVALADEFHHDPNLIESAILLEGLDETAVRRWLMKDAAEQASYHLALKGLLQMGFESQLAATAIKKVGPDCERAIFWLMDEGKRNETTKKLKIERQTADFEADIASILARLDTTKERTQNFLRSYTVTAFNGQEDEEEALIDRYEESLRKGDEEVPLTRQIVKGTKKKVCKDCGETTSRDCSFILEHRHHRVHLCKSCLLSRAKKDKAQKFLQLRETYLQILISLDNLALPRILNPDLQDVKLTGQETVPEPRARHRRKNAIKRANAMCNQLDLCRKSWVKPTKKLNPGTQKESKRSEKYSKSRQ